ncbi:unnamed protein product [Vitrella brassicaformis CCMP3155]|uniref:AP2/ERF domain-containing protein n=1 Tax=Vitrella brassicaformis (strain CCMP3155) TaxID=1169540 RepID=A0A0G4EU48_VITBC|nr:unnamed protein product [Vitrella brassicaformis CCMP3155]|eukprot:CEM01930.1 unnamed protein product [Vitrella brassicaformis CCMP3155]
MQQPTVEQPSAVDGGQAVSERGTSAEVACLDAGQLTVHNEAMTEGQTPHASEAATSDAGKAPIPHRREHQSSVAAVDARSSSPHSRRRPKAAKSDGASVSAGDVWSSICMSDPQWAADRESKAGSKGKTVITKSEHQSDVVGVRWHNAGQAWQSGWYEKGDPNKKSKYFYVKEHGFDRAKALAEEHRREMERTGCASVRKLSKHQSGVKGVYYEKRSNAWVANWYEDGRQREKRFSARQLGYEGAKQAAISHRRKMEKRHHEYRVAASSPPPSFELDDNSRPPIRTSKRRRKSAMHHSSTPDEIQPTDSNGRPAGESAADIARLGTTCDTAALAVLLEGVRASDPESGGRYEIVTVTVAGHQTRAIRWMPTGVDVPSDGQVTAQAMRAARPPREERSEPLPLPHADASTTAHRNNECTDPEERHTQSSSVDEHRGHDGRVASAARSPPPKRLCGPAGRQVAGELTGDALARALVRWMRDQQPGDFHAADRGGIGISWRTNYSHEAYFWDSDASTAVDLRRFPVGYGASRAAIFTAFREAVEYRNALHRSRPRRRRKAAKRDGASVSAGDVLSSICMSDPQWAADRDKKTSTKGKTVITKSEHQSDVVGVRWTEKPPGWRVSWTEKDDSKPLKEQRFLVRDHGYDKAKALAEQHRRELERTGRASVRKQAEHQSGVKGVVYHKKQIAWVATWHEDGNQKKEKTFSVGKMGMERAKQAAIRHRRAMEAKHHRYQHKGETAGR